MCQMAVDTQKSGWRIVRSSGWLLLPKTVAAVLSLVYLALVTRTLGGAEFGKFALIFSFAQMIFLLASFQTWQTMIRYGTVLVARDDRDKLAQLTILCLCMEGGGLLFGAALSAAVLWFFGPGFGWDQPTQVWIWIFTVLLLLPAKATATGLLRVNDHFKAVAIPDMLVPAIRFVGTFCVIAWSPSIAGFLLVWLLSELIPAIIMWLVVARLVPLPMNCANISGLRDYRIIFPQIWQFTAWNKLGGLMSPQIVVVFVGYWVGSLYAGFFRLGDQLGQVLARMSDAMALAIYSEYARISHGSGDQAHARSLIAKTSWIAGIAAAILLLLLIVGGKPALGFLFGVEFEAAYPYLLFLGGASAIRAAAVGLEPALQAQGRARAATLCNLSGTVSFLGAFLALVPSRGSIGAAEAVFISACVTAVMLTITYRRISRQAEAAPSV
jgi:O-antigen/teichoic acid export membrane protein